MKHIITILSFCFFANISLSQTNRVDESSIICTMSSLDRKPDFPGGIQNLAKIIKAKISRKVVPGEVIDFEFTIGKDGKTQSIRIPNHEKHFRKRKIRKLVESLPKWLPAIKNNEVVESVVKANIKF